MRRKQREVKERKHWVLNEKVRAGLIAAGEGPFLSQSLIDRTMRAYDFLKRNPPPTPEQWEKMFPKSNPKTDE